MDSFITGDLHAGFSDLEMNVDTFDLGEGLTITKTYAHLMAHFLIALGGPAPPQSHHPGPWKVTRNPEFNFDISADLLVPAAHNDRHSISQTIGFLIRLAINPATRMAAVANHAFLSLKSVPDADTIIIPHEIMPRHFILENIDNIGTTESLQWIRDHWRTTHTLRIENEHFELAMAALNTGQFIHNHGLIIVSIWAALEALFSPSTTELRFRVSSLIAAYLEPPGPERHALQKKVVKLYDRRSSAAHGKPSHEIEDVTDTFNLLQRILLSIIAARHVPTKDELDQRLFGTC